MNFDTQEVVGDAPIEDLYIDLQDIDLELADFDETTSNNKIMSYQIKNRQCHGKKR